MITLNNSEIRGKPCITVHMHHYVVGGKYQLEVSWLIAQFAWQDFTLTVPVSAAIRPSICIISMMRGSARWIPFGSEISPTEPYENMLLLTVLSSNTFCKNNGKGCKEHSSKRGLGWSGSAKRKPKTGWCLLFHQPRRLRDGGGWGGDGRWMCGMWCRGIKKL